MPAVKDYARVRRLHVVWLVSADSVAGSRAEEPAATIALVRRDWPERWRCWKECNDRRLKLAEREFEALAGFQHTLNGWRMTRGRQRLY